MKDDIRVVQNKNNDETPDLDVKPTPEYVSERDADATQQFPGVKPELSNPVSNGEGGFVVFPEQVTHHEQNSSEAPVAQGTKNAKNPFKKVVQKFKSLNKLQKVLIIALAVILLGGGGVGAYALTRSDPPAEPPVAAPVVEKVVEPPKPTTEASKLTGVQIPIETNKRPITSIQIENSPDARPQSGLKDAGVVFEAIAEGGITRFNASFQEAQPDYIGPIRSVRPYYAQLVAPFDPIFVHAGGSGDGLAKLAQLGLKDLDHGANGNAFQRVSSRYAPHNLYSSTASLDAASAGRGFVTSDVKSLLRKEEKPPLPATVNNIVMNISSALYNTTYAYDAATNSYKRNMAGAPHTDEKSGAHISPKVVVAMSVPYSQSGIYSVYGVIGSGEVKIFQDGQITIGTWTKPSEKEQIKFTDAAGTPIGLNPGQTWITLVKGPGDVIYGL